MSDNGNGQRSFLEVYEEIRELVRGFTDEIVEKYEGCNGADWRQQISHFLEQAGQNLHSELEREKRETRRFNSSNGEGSVTW